MGTGEVSTPAKLSKPMETREDITSAKSCKSTVLTQETPTTPSQLNWQTRMQACYGSGATSPPLFTVPVASSPTLHSYVWANQHHLVQLYGSPHRYPALYHHGGLYPHPNVVAGAVLTIPEAEGNILSGKDLDSIEKCKGSSENTSFMGGRSGESGNAASGARNDGASQSAASGREGSSNASDDNTSQEISATKKRSIDHLLADVSVMEDPLVSNPAVNLNLGMSQNGSCTGTMPLKVKPIASGVSSVVTSAMMARPREVMPEKRIQDEGKVKRKERRKQSNRESARRSRLRKQQECEKLQVEVEALMTENSILNDKLMGISEECMKQNSENDSLMEELIQMYGPDAISSLEAKKPDQTRDNSTL